MLNEINAKSKLILAPPCIGKSYLTNQYPDLFIDVDVVCGSIYKKLRSNFGPSWYLLDKAIGWAKVRDDNFREFQFAHTNKIYLSAERILCENSTLRLVGIFTLDEGVHSRRCAERFMKKSSAPKWDYVKPGLPKYASMIDVSRHYNLDNPVDVIINVSSKMAIEHIVDTW